MQNRLIHGQTEIAGGKTCKKNESHSERDAKNFNSAEYCANGNNERVDQKNMPYRILVRP